MGRWICHSRRCRSVGKGGVEWEAEVPVCPTCGADGRTKAGNECVTPACVTHWQRRNREWPDEYLPGRACDGGPTADLAGARRRIELWEERGVMPTHRWQTVPDAHAVTCPACRALPDFADELSRTPKPVPVLLIGTTPATMDRGSLGQAASVPVSDVAGLTLGEARHGVPQVQPGVPTPTNEDNQNVA